MRVTPNEIDDVIKRARCDVWTSETISQCITIHRKGCGKALRLCAVSIQVFPHILPPRHFNARRCHPDMHATRSTPLSVLYPHKYYFPSQPLTTAGCPQAPCVVIVGTVGHVSNGLKVITYKYT